MDDEKWRLKTTKCLLYKIFTFKKKTLTSILEKKDKKWKIGTNKEKKEDKYILVREEFKGIQGKGFQLLLMPGNVTFSKTMAATI